MKAFKDDNKSSALKKNKKKVVLMGMIGLHNYGDNFIANCTAYLVNDFGEFDISIVDLATPMSFFKSFIYGCLYLLSLIIPSEEYKAKLVNFAVKYRCTKEYKKVLENADALIFACGSFKYGTQKLWAYYSLATSLANEKCIPVMFNAMNIQKYNNESWKCKYLRDHADMPSVKMITTRDGDEGVYRLYNDYKLRQNIICEGVGDSAFWIPDCYDIHKKEGREFIGINIIEGDAFQRYGNSLSEAELIDIYCVLLQQLDEKNIPWELFTNGLTKDYKFGKKLLNKYSGKMNKIFIPNSDIELAEKISSYKVILGARLHACICAYALEIPFVGYIWDEKLDNFSHMIGVEEFFVKEQDLSGRKLASLLLDLYENERIPDSKIRVKWMNKTKYFINEFLTNI